MCHRAQVALRAHLRAGCWPGEEGQEPGRCHVCGLGHRRLAPEVDVRSYELLEVKAEALNMEWQEVALSENLQQERLWKYRMHLGHGMDMKFIQYIMNL